MTWNAFVTNKKALWTVWCLQKDTGTPASLMLRVREWATAKTGLDGWWTALQFDRAVAWFGRHVESLLSETDEHGHTKHTLAEVLGDEPDTDEAMSWLTGMFGVINT